MSPENLQRKKALSTTDVRKSGRRTPDSDLLPPWSPAQVGDTMDDQLDRLSFYDGRETPPNREEPFEQKSRNEQDDARPHNVVKKTGSQKKKRVFPTKAVTAPAQHSSQQRKTTRGPSAIVKRFPKRPVQSDDFSFFEAIEFSEHESDGFVPERSARRSKPKPKPKQSERDSV